VIELIVNRGRALVDARSVIILLREGDELVVAARAGHAVDTGGPLPLEESTTVQVMQRRRAERIGDVASRVGLVPRELGVADARSALLVPLVFRDESLGVLAAFDRGENGRAFLEEDEEVLRAFAAGAATAVATGKVVSALRGEDDASAGQAANRPRRSA
jgi:GAF domain-containing protein